MSDPATFGFPEAARRLHVPVRDLRRAIRDGKIPAPAKLTATATLSAEWLAQSKAVVAASPKTLARTWTQKVAPFARYPGTSAWRKYAKRVREYAHYRASVAGRGTQTPTG